jgi:MtN3 and saliva related transmembrane protein
VAATLTTLSFVFQVIKIFKTQDTEAISLSMYSIFVTGVFGWIIYGAYLGSLQMIIANTITFILAGTILIMKIKTMLSRKS